MLRCVLFILKCLMSEIFWSYMCCILLNECKVTKKDKLISDIPRCWQPAASKWWVAVRLSVETMMESTPLQFMFPLAGIGEWKEGRWSMSGVLILFNRKHVQTYCCFLLFAHLFQDIDKCLWMCNKQVTGKYNFWYYWLNIVLYTSPFVRLCYCSFCPNFPDSKLHVQWKLWCLILFLNYYF